MQPGWYAHVQNPGAVAYFDGRAWGTVRNGYALGPEIQATITPLRPGHPGPAAPFEMLVIKGARTRAPGAGWFWGVGASAAVIVMGLLTGFSDAGSYCGAPFRNRGAAELMDALAREYGLGVTSYEAACRSSIAEATARTWVLIIIGLMVLFASFIIQAIVRSGQANRAAVTASTATVSVQIEDLARLRDKGLVTPEEFEWKRQELLRRS